MNLEDIKSYYEKHPSEFFEDYFGIKLLWYQKVIIELLNKS